MTKDLRQLAARHLLWLAQRRLRECEDAFTEHLADDALPYLADIAKAEEQVAEAITRLIAADRRQRTQSSQTVESAKHLEEALERFVKATRSDIDAQTNA